MQAGLFMYFCIKNCIGNQGEDLSTVKLPTILRRWSWCNSYFMWLCVFTGRFVLSPALLSVLVFLVLFSIVITSLGAKRAGICAFRAFVCLCCTHSFLFVYSSSWCKGLAAVCDCGTPCGTFLLTLLGRFLHT